MRLRRTPKMARRLRSLSFPQHWPLSSIEVVKPYLSTLLFLTRLHFFGLAYFVIR